MPTFGATQKGYGKLWDEAVIKAAREPELAVFVQRALDNKAKYHAVQVKTGCPWYVIAAIHMRESSASFLKHLHEGSPLSERTKLVPKGRPKGGEPPFTWQESAVDALSVPPHNMKTVGRWSVERMLFEFEKYNGFGYMGKTNSPYVWAGTTVYIGGKYVRDGVFDPTYVDKQLGCAAMVKALALRDPDVAARLKDREALPPKDVIDEEKKKEAKTGKVVTGTGSAGGAASGSSVPVVPPSFKPYVGICIGVAAAIITVGVVLWIKGHWDAEKRVKTQWLGESP